MVIEYDDLTKKNLYRDEASKALNRRDDLTDLKRRLSSNRDLLDADHASKPWLKFRSVSQKSLDLEQVKEDSGQGSVIKKFPAVYILFTSSKQLNLRIPNPQYFVYLLDQQ